jgi:hypothetical protein
LREHENVGELYTSLSTGHATCTITFHVLATQVGKTSRESLPWASASRNPYAMQKITMSVRRPEGSSREMVGVSRRATRVKSCVGYATTSSGTDCRKKAMTILCVKVANILGVQQRRRLWVHIRSAGD